jgi:ABC-2 type transport system permease protein
MHKSFERIKQMVIKEFIQILRDKRMKAIVFVVPVLQTLVFGFAVTTDVNNSRSFPRRPLPERSGN